MLSKLLKNKDHIQVGEDQGRGMGEGGCQRHRGGEQDTCIKLSQWDLF